MSLVLKSGFSCTLISSFVPTVLDTPKFKVKPFVSAHGKEVSSFSMDNM